jgi:ketosteroid isomerase-like protein
MSTPVTRERVEEFFVAFSARHSAIIEPFLDDEVLWTITGPVNLLPFCGQRRGKAAVMDLVDRLVPDIIDVHSFVQDVRLVDGEWSAAMTRVVGTQRTTGRTISYRLAQFVHFRNDKVVEYRSLIDSFDAAEQVLGRRIAPPVDFDDDLNVRTGTNVFAV